MAAIAASTAASGVLTTSREWTAIEFIGLAQRKGPAIGGRQPFESDAIMGTEVVWPNRCAALGEVGRAPAHHAADGTRPALQQGSCPAAPQCERQHQRGLPRD